MPSTPTSPLRLLWSGHGTPRFFLGSFVGVFLWAECVFGVVVVIAIVTVIFIAMIFRSFRGDQKRLVLEQMPTLDGDALGWLGGHAVVDLAHQFIGSA